MQAHVSRLPHRAVIRVTGPDWAPFLKGLCTAHIDELVEESSAGTRDSLHYGAFLRPQGKMYADVLMRAAGPEDIRLDVPLSARDEIVAKLNMYKLRAKVVIEPLDSPVFVAFGGELPSGFLRDPRSSIVSPDAEFGMAYTEQTATAEAWDWIRFRMSLGLAEPGSDFGVDELYAIDANLDILGAIDFHKGCYVGQELTSRMKRRGQIKNRILPFTYADEAQESGTEILCGDRRAGEVLTLGQGMGLALMRLDRLDGDLSLGNAKVEILTPAWIKSHLQAPSN